MFFTEEKLTRRIAELEPLRYRDERPIHEFQVQPGTANSPGSTPPAKGSWTAMHLGETWAGTDAYLWLTTTVAVPATWRGKTIMGLFDFGTTGAGYNSGFEALLFVDGHPYQGVDSNHQEVLLSENVAGREVDLAFQLWSGLGGMDGYHLAQTHCLKRAALVWLDDDCDDLYYTATVALQTAQSLEQSHPHRFALLTALSHAFQQLDWREKGSAAFYTSVAAANAVLHQELAKLEKHHTVTVHSIGHTHIDVAWLWRLRHTREKSARSVATVLRLMEHYPDYKFLLTQPQLLDFLKTDYPELFRQVKERVAEGRFEVEGGMWLEADCNLPSGESLVRQILMGSRFLKREFGVTCRYLWLPDVFGYSWALPQILKKSGLSTFMTTKISWNQYNRMPHDTFWWRGLDGSEVLTHFITTPPPAAPKGNWRYVYEGDLTPQTVLGAWEAYQDKALNQDLLIAYGHGDGGGGVTRDMLERRRRMEFMPGLPRTVTNTAGRYFEKLQATVASSQEYVHHWDGELYLEFHRGTYTSQAYNKRMNRKLELRYRQAEWLSAVASIQAKDWKLYPHHQLTDGWKILLRNQFHDIIPGSAIHEVYEDSRAEYAQAEQLVAELEREAWSTLLEQNPQDSPMALTWTVWNQSPWPQTGLVGIEDDRVPSEGVWLSDGQPLSAAFSDGRWWIEVPDVPAMGARTIVFRHGGATGPQQADRAAIGTRLPADERDLGDATATADTDTVFQVWEGGLKTPWYEIFWDNEGHLTRIWDATNQREVLQPGELGNLLQVFEDKPLNFDAWDIDLFYREKCWTVSDCQEAAVIEATPLRAVVRFRWNYGNSTIGQEMTVYSYSRRIDFVTEVDWHERQQLLKVAFPVQIRATEATYDIQFGNVKRPTHWNTSWDWARFETVGHQWADLSEYGYGVSLLNDCKYGYDIHDNVLRLSLIKSAIRPDPTADEGIHSFTYSLLPHAGDWRTGDTAKEAFALNAPMLATTGSWKQGQQPPFIRLSSETVMVDAVKKAEDSSQVVIRLHDFSGGRQNVTVDFGFPVDGWQLCDLMEAPQGVKASTLPVQLEFGPYEIHTLLLDV